MGEQAGEGEGVRVGRHAREIAPPSRRPALSASRGTRLRRAVRDPSPCPSLLRLYLQKWRAPKPLRSEKKGGEAALSIPQDCARRGRFCCWCYIPASVPAPASRHFPFPAFACHAPDRPRPRRVPARAQPGCRGGGRGQPPCSRVRGRRCGECDRVYSDEHWEGRQAVHSQLTGEDGCHSPWAHPRGFCPPPRRSCSE